MANISPITRWDLVAVARSAELRRMTDEAKLAQVGALMASVDAMGWTSALQEGDYEVWMRWQAIRAHASRRLRSARKK